MSFTTPSSVYDLDVKTRDRKLLKRQEVLGGFDPTRYVSERVWATASDGTKIPVSIVHKKDSFQKDGTHPLLLLGYGSYGISFPVFFDSNRISLLDRGIVFGVSHIRGGGEYGKRWHDAGRMMNKRTTFSDFIACAEALIAQGYTSRDRLIANGGLAGGLLMGAIVNMRPDLFRGILAQVPFVDVVNSMLDESLPLTIGEFEEWGNPKEKAAYDYMMSYSPYDNVKAQQYPSMLVVSSYNDSQVLYHEPAKWVARLRAMKTDSNVLLLKMNLDPAGHGGKSGRYEQLEEQAFEYAWILTTLASAHSGETSGPV
jgi:oligopeptidase B